VQTNPPANLAIYQLLLLGAILIPGVLFLLTQQNTLKAIRPENRLMKPGLVWLQFIPFAGQVWQFFVVTNIAGSIKQEMESTGEDSILGFADTMTVEELRTRPTFNMGITYCSLNVVYVLLNLVTRGRTSTLLSLLALAGMVCWIIYWVQLAACKKKLIRFAVA
jgi:hypothetical protein